MFKNRDYPNAPASEVPGTKGQKIDTSGIASSSNGEGRSVPTIALPKGGGAIKGIGEKFAANPVTGTGSLTIPLPLSPGRSGFTPALALSYDSGAGNGRYGCGWRVDYPSIMRRTDRGLPQYLDDQGNAAVSEYVAEDGRNVDTGLANEANRDDSSRSANRYLKRVKYANRTSRLVQPDLAAIEWLLELVMDYGDHDAAAPAIAAT